MLSPTWITGSCVSLTNYLKLYVNLLNHFQWTSLFIVLDMTANPVYLDLFPSLLAVINSDIHGSQVTVRRINTSETVDYLDLLREFRKNSRGRKIDDNSLMHHMFTQFDFTVALFLGHGDPLRRLMVELKS